MENNHDEIEELLAGFKAQRESKEQAADLPEPPKKRGEIIDFAKENPTPVDDKQEPKPKKVKAPKPEKPKKTAQEIAQQKALRKEKLSDVMLAVKRLVTSKKFYIPIIIIALFAVAIAGTTTVVNYSKTAYLKPYQKAYPSVTFPVGIKEKYCDDFGKNPSLQGYIQIEDIGYDSEVTTITSQTLAGGAQRFNYVVYLDNTDLEAVYSTIDGYNSSSKTITYTDLINDYKFEVVGAFYTNTNEEDDDGYIFPYDTTELMTQKSMKEYIDRITTRLTYNTNTGGVSHEDLLLTISCPTDYKKDYRFVVICKRVDKIKPDLTATPKEKSHLTQREYDEKGIQNPYRFASKWYPEIIITTPDGTQTTQKRTIKYYKK